MEGEEINIRFQTIHGHAITLRCNRNDTRDDLINRYWEARKEELLDQDFFGPMDVKMVFQGKDGSAAPPKTLIDLCCKEGDTWHVILRRRDNFWGFTKALSPRDQKVEITEAGLVKRLQELEKKGYIQHGQGRTVAHPPVLVTIPGPEGTPYQGQLLSKKFSE